MLNKRQVALLMMLFAGIIMVDSCRFYFKTTADSFISQKSPQSVEHGKNLAFLICGGCHYDPVSRKFIGKSLNDLPKIAGHLYSANLTQSPTHGLPPLYSDAELFYLLRTGIARDGHFAPYMMRPTMADEDINDIIAFLRSNDPSVTAADTTVGHTHINFMGKAGIRFVTKPQPYTRGIQRPAENDTISYGRYLVGIIGCYHCHSKKVLGLNYQEPEKSKGYLQGGIKLKDPKGKILFGPNLTPDNATGIGNFTIQNFREAVTEGIAPSGRKLSPPMPRFDHLTDGQLKAIYNYLQSLPPVHHHIKRTP